MQNLSEVTQCIILHKRKGFPALKLFYSEYYSFKSRKLYWRKSWLRYRTPSEPFQNYFRLKIVNTKNTLKWLLKWKMQCSKSLKILSKVSFKSVSELCHGIIRIKGELMNLMSRVEWNGNFTDSSSDVWHSCGSPSKHNPILY